MIVVTRCGHDSNHKTKFTMLRKTGVSNYILLIVKTEAYFEINGSIITTSPNMVILFDRNTYMHYGSLHNSFNDDWIHFDFIKEKPIFNDLKLPFNEPIYLPQTGVLSNYARMLVQESLTNSIHKKLMQDSIMRLLLYSIDSQLALLPATTNSNKYDMMLNQLRMNIQNTPHKRWSVEAMAKSVHMSQSYFQHVYKELFKVSCVQDVINARMERAKFYLTTTDISIKSLSDICGYENELNFMRQFKKAEGFTPTEYRRLYRAEQ
jgi:AraC-like DNA-binding protein